MQKLWQLFFIIAFSPLEGVKECTAFHVSRYFYHRGNKLIHGAHSLQSIHLADVTKRSMVQQNNESDQPPLDFAFKGIKSAQLSIRNMITEGFGTRARNVAFTMSVDDVVVPLCANLDQRQDLANRGIYPGVDYKVCELSLVDDDNKVFFQSMKEVPQTSRNMLVARVRPIYPLRKNLERDDWPVAVKPLVDVPLWLSQGTYQAGTALSTLMVAIIYLILASIVAFFIRITYVPSESMMPALNAGDVVLVTRPIFRQHPSVSDIVLFNPPKELDRAIENAINRMKPLDTDQQPMAVVSTKGKQLLKRVVAAPGEKVGVQNSQPFVLSLDDEPQVLRTFGVSPYAHPEIFPPECWDRPALSPLQKDEYFVAGDNGRRSVDSRVWGPLKKEYLIGTAKFILFPPEHFGMIPPGPFETNLENP
jgi:signal peptidase I